MKVTILFEEDGKVVKRFVAEKDTPFLSGTALAEGLLAFAHNDAFRWALGIPALNPPLSKISES